MSILLVLVLSGPAHPIYDGLFYPPVGPGMFLQFFVRKRKNRQFSSRAVSGENNGYLLRLKLETLNTMNFRRVCSLVFSYKYLQR